MRRSTETVLRGEIATAEKMLEVAARRVEAAQTLVTESIRRKSEADLARQEAKDRRDRAEAALKAYLPEPE